MNYSKEEILIQGAELLLREVAKLRNAEGNYGDADYAYGQVLGELLFRMSEGRLQEEGSDRVRLESFIAGVQSQLKQWLCPEPTEAVVGYLPIQQR